MPGDSAAVLFHGDLVGSPSLPLPTISSIIQHPSILNPQMGPILISSLTQSSFWIIVINNGISLVYSKLVDSGLGIVLHIIMRRQWIFHIKSQVESKTCKNASCIMQWLFKMATLWVPKWWCTRSIIFVIIDLTLSYFYSSKKWLRFLNYHCSEHA